MHEQPPQQWWRGRRGLIAAAGALVALVGLVVGVANPDTRGGVGAFAVRAWQLPVSKVSSAGNDINDIESGPAGTTPPEQSSPAVLQWNPSVHTTWQWLPTGSVDLASPVGVYDLPLATTAPATVADIHAHGAHAVCWLPIGVISTSDPNLHGLDHTLLGNVGPGHPDERYLDLRRVRDLTPFISARIDECWTKGFDGVDAAALDTYLTAGPQGVGFAVGYADTLTLGKVVADLAHARGLAVGLHAEPTDDARDQLVTAFEPLNDFAVVERCATARLGCTAFARYTRRGKAVLHLEYLTDYPGTTVATAQTALRRFCPPLKPLGFSSILKDGSGRYPSWRMSCP